LIFNRCQDFWDFPPLKVVGISKTICNCNNESNVSVLLSFIQSKFVDYPRNTILMPVVLNIPEKGFCLGDLDSKLSFLVVLLRVLGVLYQFIVILSSA
jgi:hypothetical protein